jgi:uncharacterized membrane protein YbhN (UPF0104 family)
MGTFPGLGSNWPFSRAMEPHNKVVSFILSVITHSIEGFLALNSVKKIAMVVSFSMVVWINEALMAYTISRFLHLDLPFIHSAALIVGLSIGVMIPGAPGFIGTYEFFGKQMLEFLGYLPDPAIGMVLVLHFFQMISVSLGGIVSFFFLKTRRVNKETVKA